jgi:hypothetical protein
MTSFSPLNFYTFAAARGEFLRPEVRELLKGASVGPFSYVTIWRDGILRSEPDPRSEVIRKRLDALLFPESLPTQTSRLDALKMRAGRKGPL